MEHISVRSVEGVNRATAVSGLPCTCFGAVSHPMDGGLHPGAGPVVWNLYARLIGEQSEISIGVGCSPERAFIGPSTWSLQLRFH